jgi:type IV secretion system protein VirB10
MSATIEPADTNEAGGAPAGAHGTGDRVDPSIIPSIAQHAHTGPSTSTKALIVMLSLVCTAALFYLLWRMIHRPMQLADAKAPPPAVASASGAVKKFDPVLPAPTETDRSAAGDEDLPEVPRIVVVGKRDPAGVRGTGPNAGRAADGSIEAATGSAAPRKLSEDAPVLLSRPGAGGISAGTADAPADGSAADPLAQARADLAQYRHQLGASLQTLQAMMPGGAGLAGLRPPTATTAVPAAGMAAAAQTTAGLGGGGRGVLGMQASDTPAARAAVLGNRSLMLPQGTSLSCALTTRVVSAQAGFIGCQVLRNVYGVDGRVLLIERGSHLDGEYRVTQVRPGTTRIPALWTRLRTPGGVAIDLDSPATGPLGESGADAYVDNRWSERVGAAMLVSIIDDSIKIVLSNETARQQGSNTLTFQGTAQTASQMAEKVLDATVNLPPLLYANQGGLVGVYVARDIDFSSVYELAPTGQ